MMMLDSAFIEMGWSALVRPWRLRVACLGYSEHTRRFCLGREGVWGWLLSSLLLLLGEHFLWGIA